MLADVFGYDRFAEVTSEYKIKGQFVDLATKIGDKLTMLLEVKAIGLKLNDQHLFQAASYAAQEGVEWVAVTNGGQWNLYRIEFKQPVTTTKVVALDFFEHTLDPDGLLARTVGNAAQCRGEHLAAAERIGASEFGAGAAQSGGLKEIGAEPRRSTGY
jgi:hypothetical protein